MTRRKHTKIQELPEDVRAAVNDLLAGGRTYGQIAEYLKGAGHEVGRSSVGRYAQDVAEAARELGVITEQLRPVLEKIGEQPNLELGSVAAQMGLMALIGFLKSQDIKDDTKRANAISAVCSAAAQLQRSQAVAEKLRLAEREKKEKAERELDALASRQGITAEVVEKIKACYAL